jgi:hypothetical protein
MPEIIIDIDLNGEVHMEGKGYRGKSCDEAMGQFEKVLGRVTDRKDKPEYLRAEVKGHGSQRV